MPLVLILLYRFCDKKGESKTFVKKEENSFNFLKFWEKLIKALEETKLEILEETILSVDYMF